jgi:hypothetical protein
MPRQRPQPSSFQKSQLLLMAAATAGLWTYAGTNNSKPYYNGKQRRPSAQTQTLRLGLTQDSTLLRRHLSGKTNRRSNSSTQGSSRSTRRKKPTQGHSVLLEFGDRGPGPALSLLSTLIFLELEAEALPPSRDEETKLDRFEITASRSFRLIRHSLGCAGR